MNWTLFFKNLFIKACKLICHKKCLSKIITDCSTRQARQVGTDLQNPTTNITVRFDESTNIDGFCVLIVCAALVSLFPCLACDRMRIHQAPFTSVFKCTCSPARPTQCPRWLRCCWYMWRSTASTPRGFTVSRARHVERRSCTRFWRQVKK